jgi:hypothetical protein
MKRPPKKWTNPRNSVSGHSAGVTPMGPRDLARALKDTGKRVHV